jgi:hypothetical protein
MTDVELTSTGKAVVGEVQVIESIATQKKSFSDRYAAFIVKYKWTVVITSWILILIGMSQGYPAFSGDQ